MDMTLEQAVKNAIETERAAARFYEIMQGFTDDEVIREFLKKMQEQEQTHAEEIARIGAVLEAGELPAGGDTRLFETLRAPEWAATENMTLGEALEVALEAERRATAYYSVLSQVTSGGAGEFFSMMERVEAEHVEALERESKKWNEEASGAE
jgi:rubrerythrin